MKTDTLSARLRSQVQQSAHWDSDDATGALAAAATATTALPSSSSSQHSAKDVEHLCPRHVKPLLYFYKYLQPIPENGRKLRLNVPITVVCERANGQEDMLWLRTDALGLVVKEESSSLPWRKKLHSELISATTTAASTSSGSSPAANAPAAAAPEPPMPIVSSGGDGGDDGVVAVRNVAHWKSGSNNKSVVLTAKTFDTVVNAPSELAFSIQQFVRCRGSHASMYRVLWSDKERKCFAVNIVNDAFKTSEAADLVFEAAPPPPPCNSTRESSTHSLHAQHERTAFDVAMQKLVYLSQFYCVSSTSDPKKCHRMPKIRGNPIMEGVSAVKRIVDHVQAQLPGIRIPAMAADFIKDSDGTWWFIRVVHFDAHYRVQVPQEVMYLPESVTQIHESMRAKYFRPTHSRPAASAGPIEHLNVASQECFLCGSLCEFSKAFTDELVALVKGQPSDDSHGGVLTELAEYRMTPKMAVDTIYLLRQRGVLMPTWEAAVVSLRRSPIQTASGFTVCFLCYRIYKQQQKLHDIALELHGVFNAISGIDSSGSDSCNTVTSIAEGKASSDIFDLTFIKADTPAAFLSRPARVIVDQIHHFQTESCSILSSRPSDERHTLNVFSAVKGADVDPTCTQMRLVFFFHELQDGGPELVPADFYLEYQLGQVINRLHFEGSKCHTPNRWQLCETRIHYFCATFDAFAEYCLEKRLLIKLKTVAGDAFHGCTVLSLRPLITAAKRFGNSLLPESRTDYLVEIRTDAYGLLTLKFTLGLLVDSVPFGHVREILSGKDFLKEEPIGVYWPPPAFCYSGLVVPREWVGALTPSEYISMIPMRSHMAGHRSRLPLPLDRVESAGSAEKQKVLTRRSSEAPRRLSVNSSSSATGSLRQLEHQEQQQLPRSVLADWPMQRGSIASAHDDSGDQLRPIATRSTPLSTAILVTKRIVFRIAGDATCFPTCLLGSLLRSTHFIAASERGGVGAVPLAWRHAARFQFTRRFSIDRLFSDMKLVCIPALVVLGELLLVMLKCQMIPSRVELQCLETLVAPYWLQQEAEDDGESLEMRKLAAKTSKHLPEQRTIWNRVIRRCEVAGFHPSFRSNSPSFTSGEDAGESGGRSNTTDADPDSSSREAMQQRHHPQQQPRFSDFRAKAQALVLCEIFEEMEVLDNGYIDIAEVRSLAKCLPHNLMTHFAMPPLLDPLSVREKLTAPELTALSELLDAQQYVVFGAILTSLVQSDVLGEALAEFDRLGCGEINFEEFRDLSESALRSSRKLFSSVNAEPTANGFCIRHGHTEIYAIDGICTQCATEYREHEVPSRAKDAANLQLNSPAINEIGAAETSAPPKIIEGTAEEEGEAAPVVPLSPLKRKLGVSAREGESPLAESNQPASFPSFAIGGAEAPPFPRQHFMGEGLLDQMLEKLEAAERHILHRQESISRASLQDLLLFPSPRKSSISARRSSGMSSRRSSGMSTSHPPLVKSNTITELTELVNDAERRKREGSKQIQTTNNLQEKGRTSAAKKNKNKKKSMKKESSAPQLTSASSTSLSAMLREELRIATRARAADAKRQASSSHSQGLVDKVARVEDKRKKLDQMVLAEIEDVKRRLAKLAREA